MRVSEGSSRGRQARGCARGREVKGRAGKGVTTVSGLPLSLSDIESLATRLKKRCGSGGTVRAGRHRNSGRSSRRDRCGAGQTGMAGEEIGRLGGHDGGSAASSAQLVYHAAIAIRAVWRESFRTGPPKAQPPGNAQAHERQTLAISGERSRAGDPPKGSSAHASAAISQVLRTEGRSTPVLVSLCSFAARLRWA